MLQICTRVTRKLYSFFSQSELSNFTCILLYDKKKRMFPTIYWLVFFHMTTFWFSCCWWRSGIQVCWLWRRSICLSWSVYFAFASKQNATGGRVCVCVFFFWKASLQINLFLRLWTNLLQSLKLLFFPHLKNTNNFRIRLLGLRPISYRTHILQSI